MEHFGLRAANLEALPEQFNWWYLQIRKRILSVPGPSRPAVFILRFVNSPGDFQHLMEEFAPTLQYCRMEWSRAEKDHRPLRSVESKCFEFSQYEATCAGMVHTRSAHVNLERSQNLCTGLLSCGKQGLSESDGSITSRPISPQDRSLSSSCTRTMPLPGLLCLDKVHRPSRASGADPQHYHGNATMWKLFSPVRNVMRVGGMQYHRGPLEMSLAFRLIVPVLTDHSPTQSY